MRPGRGPIHPVIPALAVLAAGVLAVEISRVRGTTLPGATDRAVEEAVVPGVRRDAGVVQALVLLGEPVVAVLLTAALAVVCLVLRRPRIAVLAVVGPAATVAAVTVAKPLVGRLHAGSLAYPSGHAGFVTALVLTLGLLLAARAPARTVLVLLGATAAAAVLSAAMAIALVADRKHYASDSLGGFCVAVVVVMSGAAVTRCVSRERHPPRPPGTAGRTTSDGPTAPS